MVPSANPFPQALEEAGHVTPVSPAMRDKLRARLLGLPEEVRKDSPDASDVHVPAPLGVPAPVGARATRRHRKPRSPGVTVTHRRRKPGVNIRVVKAQKLGLPVGNERSERQLHDVLRRQMKLLGVPPEAAIKRAVSGQRDAYESALKWSAWETGFTAELAGVLTRVAAEEGARRMADTPMAKASGVTLHFDARSPAVLRWAKAHSASLVRSISDDTRAAIRAVIGRMYDSGIHPNDAVPLVRQALGDNALFPRWAQAVANYGIRLLGEGRPPAQVRTMTGAYYERLADARASTIARTEIIAAQNEGRVQGWQQLLASGVLDKTKLGKRWDASHEGVCPICQALDGTVVALDAVFAGGAARPPAHPNAVFAGSTFVPCGRLEEMVSAWYSGPAIRLRAGDHETTIGPNHPVLTRRGMVPARLLSEGDELIYDQRGQCARGSGVESNLEQVPLVEDAFEASLAVAAHAFVATAGRDFHGDGVYCEEEIYVVWPERYLLSVADAVSVEHLRQDGLVGAYPELASVPGSGSPLSAFDGVGLASSGGMGGCGPGCFHEFLPVSTVEATTFEGWAFDGTTETGLYLSDGFVVSNCRCVVLLVER